MSLGVAAFVSGAVAGEVCSSGSGSTVSVSMRLSYFYRPLGNTAFADLLREFHGESAGKESVEDGRAGSSLT
jgi:hypothetical protein